MSEREMLRGGAGAGEQRELDAGGGGGAVGVELPAGKALVEPLPAARGRRAGAWQRGKAVQSREAGQDAEESDRADPEEIFGGGGAFR